MGTISRYKKYRSEKALREAVEAYFDSISRVREVMEAYNTGKKDSWGHFIQELRPVTNAKGETMQEKEYVIPPTVGGLCEHLQISRDTWAKYCDRALNPQFEDTTAWAREQLLSWREKELMTRPGKDVKGLLFDLRVNYGIREKSRDAEFGGDEVQIIDDL